MFKKLIEIQKHYQELEQKLINPDTIKDQKNFQKIAKERSDLEDLMVVYDQWKKINSEIQGNKELIAEGGELGEMAEEELDQLEPQEVTLIEKLKTLLIPKDPYDGKNIILEIRAGTGGDEAALFAANLFRMYSKFAEISNWKVEVISSNSIGIGGFKEIIASISGKNVFGSLKYEGGVHRVQRVPDTETQGRIHTSAVTVAVLPEAEDVDVKFEEKDLRIDVYRSSGPGGQSVNTTDSAVRITHLPTGITVAMQDEKSQHKNKAKALKILKARILDMEREKQASEISETRRAMVGSGDRSERIRTYNFPQGRMTDHRIGLTLYKLDLIMEGDLEETVRSLQNHFQTEALRAQ
ncbi:MAG: peptide chain release factor 1 [Pseudomonadota bacterium]